MFREPPNKRRRGGGGSRGGGRGWDRYNNQGQNHRHQHWDEPGNSSGVLSYNHSAPAPAKKDKPKRYTIDHELTQNELWDDSALIQAWDAAVEEYESLNGPGKSWKEEPVHKSPLWYAPPTKPQAEEGEGDDNEEEGDEEGEVNIDENTLDNQETDPDLIPVDFSAPVSSQEPALVAPTFGPYVPATLSTTVTDVSTLTQDEIFERAVSASYWAGYWAAMYHACGTKTLGQVQVEEEEAEADEMVHVEEPADASQTMES